MIVIEVTVMDAVRIIEVMAEDTYGLRCFSQLPD